MLDRQKILESRLPFERVELPWLSDHVFVRALPLYVREQALKSEKSDAWVFVRAVVNERGERVLKDEDIDVVADTVDQHLQSVVVAASFRLAQPTADQAEEIKKNLPRQTTAASGE